MKKILKIFKFFIKKKYYFDLPSTKRLVLINSAGYKYLNQALDEELYLIDLNKSLNLQIIIKVFFKCLLKKNLDPYVEEYLEHLKPEAVFCYAHNYMQFFRINKNKNIKYIVIQNGKNHGNSLFSVFDKKKTSKNFKCDLFFCHGEYDKKICEKLVKAKYIKIGSFLNNSIKKQKKKYKKTICYLSTYRNLKNQSYSSSHSMGKDMSFEDWYKIDRIIVNFLSEYCKEKKFKLKILGSTNPVGKLSFNEDIFYKKNIKLKNWNYLPKKTFKTNYINIDENEITCFIDSSLGYESMARKNKVAIFAARGDFCKIPNFSFHDNYLPKKGLFWTSVFDQKKFRQILDSLIKIKKNNWEKELKKYNETIIKFDQGNKIFFNTLKRYNIKTNRNYFFFK